MRRIEFDYIDRHLPPRPANAHKGMMGTLCSLTGSYRFAGAAVLCAKAALRAGVGLHYQLLPECIYPIFASSVHESVCVPLDGGRTFSVRDLPIVLPVLDKASAVLIGCGMDNNESTQEFLHSVMQAVYVPLVIDADGINALAQHIHWLEESEAEIILTPHVKEFSRLSGLTVEEIVQDPETAAREFSLSHPDTVLVLKSHRTIIAQNGELYENIAGNSGMAKGGSGDVLAGIIGSLAAQGAKPLEAAVMGVHIHALAGDIAAAKLSRTAMLPSDIIASLPEVFAKAEDFRDNG